MLKTLFTPGRTELAGNHTDHQNGRVLAAAIDLGISAEFEANFGKAVQISGPELESFGVRIDHLSPRTTEFGTSKALVRGMLSAFSELGLNIGGFNAVIRSTLPPGAGLSSSAAFSVLMGKILSELFNDGAVQPIVIARAAQEAENRFFGKPCGLMSQLTCALGQTVYADLALHEIEPVVADFEGMGLTLCLTDTGGSHDGLNTSYARIPADMCYIANYFDAGVLADVDPEAFWAKGWSASDRPVRRAMHFFEENARVPLMRDALKAHNGEEYMRLMNESGRSSENLLNNIVTSSTGDTRLQEGLERSAALLDGKGAWRVHGGGFAGCVQALMPSDFFPVYCAEMEKAFGPKSCFTIHLV